MANMTMTKTPMPEQDANVRNKNFKEVSLGYTPEMAIEEAYQSGAIGVFSSKYEEKVKVYSILGYSNEICGGPHAENTGELGAFKIIKEEASSAGVRRIKAVILNESE